MRLESGSVWEDILPSVPYQAPSPFLLNLALSLHSCLPEWT